MFFKIAWRNIWRNPRRTSVILIAVIIGVWSMIFLGAIMRGMVINMLENAISNMTGHIQIHKNGFRDDPGIEKSIKSSELNLKIIENKIPKNSIFTPRVRVNAIANNSRHASSITLMGVLPDNELKMSFLGNAFIKGDYLNQDNMRGILVGKALLDKFNTKIGNKLVVMSQDTNNEIASKSFKIIGYYKTEMESVEKQFAFINLFAAQKMLKLKGISEVSITLPDYNKSDEIKKNLKNTLSKEFEIHTYKELLPLITSYLKLFDGFNAIWYIVIFIAMSFGIINTTLMAIFERMREFGVLKAIGAKPTWIIKEVLYESFFIIFIGTILGNVIGYISVIIFSKTGINLSLLSAGVEMMGMSRIIFPIIASKDIITANLIVFLSGHIISLYPAVKAARITPIKALNYN